MFLFALVFLRHVRFEVFTAVTIKNGRHLGCYAVKLLTGFSEALNTSFIRVSRIGELGKTDASCEEIFLRSLRRLLVTANVVLSSPILVTLMMEALRFLQEPHGVTSQKTTFLI
jgi:hypothetical protein